MTTGDMSRWLSPSIELRPAGTEPHGSMQTLLARAVDDVADALDELRQLAREARAEGNLAAVAALQAKIADVGLRLLALSGQQGSEERVATCQDELPDWSKLSPETQALLEEAFRRVAEETA